MQNIVVQEVTLEQPIVTSLTCDFCGLTDSVDTGCITSFNIAFGYGSKFDGDYYNLEICDKCFEKLKNEYNLKESGSYI